MKLLVSLLTERGVSTYQLITSDQYMKRRVFVVRDFFLRPELAQRSAILDITPVGQSLQLRHETGNLLLPVVQGRGRRDHQEGTPDVMRLRKVRQK